MGDMLSQAEIDALLNGGSVASAVSEPEEDTASSVDDSLLSAQEKDALGEIGNISMGTCATTLFALLGHKVTITTPRVQIVKWGDVVREFASSSVGVRVQYTQGLEGINMMILKETDVKVITDLMMGGDGTNSSGEVTDLHLSAISEAMNQMIGSSATSMSSMFSKRIDISPPKSFMLKYEPAGQSYEDFMLDQELAKISFKMEIGDIIDSEIMQLLPVDFAKNLVDNLLYADQNAAKATASKQQKQEEPAAAQPPPPPQQQQQVPPQQPMMDYGAPMQGYVQPPQGYAMPPYPQQMYAQPYPPQDMQYGMMPPRQAPQQPHIPVNVQPIQFQAFDDGISQAERENISLIMDVPLQVTVELGRTHKMIRDILEFGQGSIIELDKLAGEPVDILVNGKAIAKGEVVVIDESFGVRITDIIHPSKRL